MAVPVFVGAGAGATSTGTPVTVSKTNCTAGNLLLAPTAIRGTTDDWSFTTFVNCVRVDGVTSGLQAIITGVNVTGLSCGVYIGRVTANGTVSGDIDAGASGEDIFSRIYEVSLASTGDTIAKVVENSTATFDSSGGIAATTVDDVPVITNGDDRLALQFVALSTAQTIGAFTGETGGDWIETVAEYSDGSGDAATLQLQSAEMASAGTIGGGSTTVASTNWVNIGLAVIPATLSDIPPVAWLKA